MLLEELNFPLKCLIFIEQKHCTMAFVSRLSANNWTNTNRVPAWVSKTGVRLAHAVRHSSCRCLFRWVTIKLLRLLLLLLLLLLQTTTTTSTNVCCHGHNGLAGLLDGSFAAVVVVKFWSEVNLCVVCVVVNINMMIFSRCNACAATDYSWPSCSSSLRQVTWATEMSQSRSKASRTYCLYFVLQLLP